MVASIDCLLFKTGSTEFSSGKSCVFLKVVAGGSMLLENQLADWLKSIDVVTCLCAKTGQFHCIPPSGVRALVLV